MPKSTLAPGLAPSPTELMRSHGAANTTVLDRAWRQGELIRVVPGVYAPVGGWEALAPWDRYLARVHAVSLANPGFVFCGATAAALRGVFLGRQHDPVLILDPDRTSRVSGVVRVLTSADQRAIDEIDGIRLTSAADTAVDVARASSPGAGLAYVDALMRRTPRLTAAQLRAINESRLSSRNRRRARWALDRATGVPESVLESLSLAAMEFAGFELPETQVTFLIDGAEDRVDFLLAFAGPHRRGRRRRQVHRRARRPDEGDHQGEAPGSQAPAPSLAPDPMGLARVARGGSAHRYPPHGTRTAPAPGRPVPAGLAPRRPALTATPRTDRDAPR